MDPDTEQQERDEAQPKRPPALGERAALAGYVPQYEVAAALLLRALTEENLEWVALLDPEAGRLDDFQLATPGMLDAYQIKWSEAGGQLAWGTLRSHLVDLVGDRRKLAQRHPDRRVVGHLYGNRVGSSSTLPGGPPGATVASAIAQLLRPATEGEVSSPEELPEHGRWLWRDLAAACKLGELELLAAFRDVRIELGRPLPREAEVVGGDRAAYQRDLDELMLALLRLATDPRRLVRLTKDQLVARLGERWRERLELRSVHEFPRPIAYQPVRLTAEPLREAVGRFTTGYVALVGTPGSGKSTLLTEELRGRADVAARYYAYVPGRVDVGSMRAEASAFLHDLVLTLERRGLPRGPALVDFEVSVLTARLARLMGAMGERFRREGKRSIILVDGLDHVERARDVEQPLLRFLPRPEELPDGVLFVLGSQTIKMLDPDIRAHLEEPRRTVQMGGLDLASVAELARVSGVTADPGRLWQVSDGHPLILTYLLQRLADLPPGEQDASLAVTPPYRGDVFQLYMRLWATVEEDAPLVELLALACRMRGAVDLAWLRDCGQPPAVTRRLRDRLAHLFRRETDRLYFFHESFRLFLQERSARVGDKLDPAEDRRLHRQLAEMCRVTPASEPRSWELLYHLSAAEEHGAVLETATPEFFRSQLLALRPLELVGADIRLAARSLALVQDPMALVRLVIAAAELSQRGYHLPARERFLSLLVQTGQWRTAVEHMEVEREGLGEEDSRTGRLHISLLLRDGGLYEDARKVFETNEPWELLSGRAEPHGLRGPYQLLYAWARAAAVLRGPDAVLEAAEVVQLPRDPHAPPREEEDPTPAARAWMLAAAADELDARGQTGESDRLLATLDPMRPAHRRAWVWTLAGRWGRQEDRAAHLVTVITDRLLPEDLGSEDRVVVAEGLWKAGQRDQAGAWIVGLHQQTLPDASSLRDIWGAERPRYRLNRLLAALGQGRDPEMLVPATKHDWELGYVKVARITVAIAQLHGFAWAGQRVAPSELMATARPVLDAFAIGEAGDWSLSYELGQMRPHALAQLLHVARLHGREAAQRLWQEYERRWQEKPGRLRQEGHRVLPAALEVGVIPRAVVLERLRQLEDLVQATAEGGDAPTDLTDLAETMFEAGLTEDATRLLRQAVSASLAIYYRKDYQLSDWINLLGPRLEGDGGADLVRWLAGAVADLRDQATGAQANDAAQRLLLACSALRSGHAWRIGAWLEQRKVVDWDDRVAALLEAQLDHAADPLWWRVLVDQLVPIATEPEVSLLAPAARRATAAHGLGWLRHRLRILVNRVGVEAPPHTREQWWYAVADRAAEHGIPLSELDLPAELHPDLRPPRSRARGTDEDQRDAFLAAHNTVESLVAEARAANLSDWAGVGDWAEAVDLVADQMDLVQVREAASIFASAGWSRLGIHVRLARRSLQLGAPDLASEFAEVVLTEAEPRSWLLHWDGGPLLGALRLLAELDPAGTRDRAYRRFAADAASDNYLLSEVSRELDQLLELFGMDDRGALGQEVERYVRVLLDEPAEQPPAQLDGAEDDAPTVMARAGLDLLAYPYRLAVTTAQRALVAGLQEGDRRIEGWLVRALQGDDEELALRTLSVLETALETGALVRGDVAGALHRWTVCDHLGLRLASRRLVERLGHGPESPVARDLPAAYRLVVPEREEPVGVEEGEPLGRDDLDVTLARAEGELRRLAEVSGVDVGTVNARVATLARQLAGEKPVDDSRWRRDSSPLGWTFYRPSVILWERAAARVAGELVDAGRLEPERALLISTGSGYDPGLIAARPSRRPEAVLAVPEAEETRLPHKPWLEGLEGAEDRLASRLAEGWTVIGEHTELRRLDAEMPRERRFQTLGILGLLDRDDRADGRRRTRVAALQDMPAVAGAAPLVYHWDVSYRGPSAWLALHPRLAEACGWERDPGTLIGWRDDEGTVVRSLWWRSGWLDSSPWLATDQVGEGWLVVAQSHALDRLAEVLGGDLGVAWQVERDFLVPGKPSETKAGVRALRS